MPVRIVFHRWNRSGSADKRPPGPDHQRIAKLDRENEVAPPPKVNPSVGKVRHYSRIMTFTSTYANRV